MIIIGQKYTRNDGYVVDLSQSQAEEILPHDCNEIQDSFQYTNLTTGSQTKTISLVGSVNAIKEVSISVGSVGNEYFSVSQFSCHRTNTTGDIDESYPSDTMLGKSSMNVAPILIFDKPKFSTQDLQIVLNHGASSNKLVCVNIRYFSKDYN